ncbi:AMP-binding protein [Acidithiobacillus sp. AMEEHan]|uniref:AMP-binding protein n=1 Tax=Acidithiobacillus sp. AMEEHan TaxID=2994951 RepID=UPI0027E4B30A|nr:AMP-binding protein [Acidithiobacillus sp. AMEEHan]
MTKAFLFAQHGDNSVIARRGEQSWTIEQFQQDVAALAKCLPECTYIINICADRYRFLVSFAAALVRQQVTIMPASIAPEALRLLSQTYRDTYAITDRGDLPIPHLIFPKDLHASGAVPKLQIPGQQVACIQFTSGSTADPKPVQKTWSTLVHSARAAGERLAIHSLGGGNVVSTVPHQHSYGLESNILLALQYGLAVEAGTPLYPADVLAILSRTPRPRILVTTPVHLRALVTEQGEIPVADLLLSATAALPTSLAIAAEERFQAPLMEIYGCTEAGQIASRRTSQGGVWHLFEGISVFQNEAGSWAEGPSVEGVAPLQDVLDFTGPRHFRLGARAQDMVNVAGKRSSLPYLNTQLLSIPGVEDGVFLMEEDADGMVVQRLMAVVVAPTLTVEAVRRGLRDRLDPAFLPRKLMLVDALPRNATGKVVRNELLALLARAQ